jgi:hypothetical protein
MSANSDASNGWWRWSAGWLTGAVGAFIVSLFFARLSFPFVLSSIIVCCVALSIHLYRLRHPSQHLDFLLIVILVMGFQVVRAWVSGVAMRESVFYFSFSLALLSATTLLFEWKRRRTGI